MSDKQSDSQNHAQILRYLRKQMTTDELSAFEVRLMNDSDLIRETQREEALIAALREYQDALVQSEPASRILNFREWMLQPLTAAAAVVVLIVSVPMLGLQQFAVREAAVESLLIASTHYVEGLRSAVQSQAINADFPVLLNVDAGPDSSGKSYTLQLQDTVSGAVLYEAENQVTGAEGYLALILRDPLQGDFEIVLTDESGVSESKHYPITFQ